MFKEVFTQIKSNARLKIFIGIFFIILGLLIHFVPLLPGSWVIFIGLEILGIRLLLQKKFREKFKNSKFINKIFGPEK